MSKELKPCPFCGKEIDINKDMYLPERDWKPSFYDPDSGGDPINIHCECGLKFSIGYCDYADFLKAWNRRVTDERCGFNNRYPRTAGGGVMTVKEWLEETFRREPVGCLVRPHAICKDGFSISIQASAFHYCTPRRGLKDCKYTHLELGYPSEHEDLLDGYREGTIFPYVPIKVVEEVIEKHGGIVGC